MNRLYSFFVLIAAGLFSLIFPLALWLALCIPIVQAQQASGSGDAVGFNEVSIEGAQRIDPAAIKQQLQSKPPSGTRRQIGDDVKELYKTGFFDQINASIVKSGSASKLVFKVTEKPVVRKTLLQGNEVLTVSDLEDVIKFDTRRFLDKTKVDQIIRQMRSLYQSRGFYDAAITYSVLAVGENEVDLTFNIEEGKRLKIRDLEIRGLQVVDDSDVLSVMNTTTYKWWNSWLLGTGRLNNEMLEADRSLMRQYFFDNGFIDVQISDPLIERDGDGLRIVFNLNEGQQYKVGTVRASGEILEDGEGKTLDGIKSASGEVFSASAVREDTFKITEKFTDLGYAFANVVPETEVDKDAGRVNLNFGVSRGNLARINRVNIRGNDKTYDNVIRRELKVDEQEMYSGSKVRRSQEALQRLGYFEEVSIAPEPVGDDQVNLNVGVREASTGSFSAGAGYSTSDGLLFNARLAENNIMGTGRSASINLDVGTERDSVVLSLDDRRLGDTYWAGGIDVLRTDREFSDFDRRLAGGSLTFGYPLEQVFSSELFYDIQASMKYEYLDIEISDVDQEDAADLVIESEGTSRASAFTPRLTRNTINNPLNPSRGSRQELSVELAGAGGNQEFFLLEARNTLYHPLLSGSYGDLVFSWRINAAYGESFDDEPFPLYRRFFPGGINSVRGYKNRTLGPKDSRGNEYGGSKQLVNNLELIFPLIAAAGVKGVVFFDAGEAFDDNESIDLGELRQAYGAGLRWASPLGPIRVEFGFPLDREEGEDSMVTLFSFGAPL